jgi:hypothetical protein
MNDECEMSDDGESGFVVYDGWLYERFERQDFEWLLAAENQSARDKRLAFLRHIQSFLEEKWLPEEGVDPNEWIEPEPEMDEIAGEPICTGSKFVADRYEVRKSSSSARCLAMAVKGAIWATKLGWWESSRLEVMTETERRAAVDYVGDLMDHLGDLIRGDIG